MHAHTCLYTPHDSSRTSTTCSDHVRSSNTSHLGLSPAHGNTKRNRSPPRTRTHLGVRHAVAVGALDVEANPGPLALVYRVLVVHVLDEVPPALPVPIIIPSVYLQGRPEVVCGLGRRPSFAAEHGKNAFRCSDGGGMAGRGRTGGHLDVGFFPPQRF